MKEVTYKAAILSKLFTHYPEHASCGSSLSLR